MSVAAGVPPAVLEQPVLSQPTLLPLQHSGPYNFLRNERPNPTEYSGERPELSSQQREITEGQNKKEN